MRDDWLCRYSFFQYDLSPEVISSWSMIVSCSVYQVFRRTYGKTGFAITWGSTYCTVSACVHLAYDASIWRRLSIYHHKEWKASILDELFEDNRRGLVSFLLIGVFLSLLSVNVNDGLKHSFFVRSTIFYALQASTVTGFPLLKQPMPIRNHFWQSATGTSE